jgi:hypothetical protein
VHRVPLVPFLLALTRDAMTALAGPLSVLASRTAALLATVARQKPAGRLQVQLPTQVRRKCATLELRHLDRCAFVDAASLCGLLHGLQSTAVLKPCASDQPLRNNNASRGLDCGVKTDYACQGVKQVVLTCGCMHAMHAPYTTLPNRMLPKHV